MLFQKVKTFQFNKNFIWFIFVFLAVYSAEAQQPVTVEAFAGTITESDLKKHLEIIAHDSLEGRETGKVGQRKAAKYLAAQFEKMGLRGVVIDDKETYFQSIELLREKWGEISITVNGEKHKNLQDVLYIKNRPVRLDQTVEVIYGGYGGEETLGELDVRGKGLVVRYAGKNGKWEEVADRASEAGVTDLFIAYGKSDDDINEPIKMYRNYFRNSSLRLSDEDGRHRADDSGMNVFFIQPKLTEKIFGISQKKLRSAAEKSKKGRNRRIKRLASGSISYRIEYEEEVVETENVLGFVLGQEYPEEVVIVSAHYDHVGIRGDRIYNGADDNGSGTAAVLELAEAFSIAAAKKMGPKRSVLFLLFSGEEKGLLGSKYYVQHPVFSMENTIGDFNIDMIGRIDKRYVDDPDYVYLIGSDKISMELHDISERINKDFIGLKLDYTYNDDSDPNRYYYRSDHYNFARSGIPVIFYFTGVHNDYHKPTDTVDKILFDRMTTIVKLVFHTVWEISNMDSRLSKE